MATTNLIGESTDGKLAGVKGECTGAGGFGVWGICATGHGVHGQSVGSKGVVGESEAFHGVFGKSRDNVGVAAESQNAEAMNAQSQSAKHAAIIAINHANGVGVEGHSGGNVAVLGVSKTGRGVMGISNTNLGVSGESQLFPGVRGTSVRGRGTEGFSTILEGVVGISKQSTGVLGISEARGAGVIGQSNTGVGIHGKGGRLAGLFEGDVEVTGDIRLSNADCAEHFDIAGAMAVEPGTVMVLDDAGALSASTHAYDKRVAGVVSGAGDYKPALVLDTRETGAVRQPIALLGKVFCKVDAQFGAIGVGDLLTTSPTSGHAMATSDPLKSFGAVIGKALRPWTSGQGLIPILIALQ
jgi:hypothetical protein